MVTYVKEVRTLSVKLYLILSKKNIPYKKSEWEGPNKVPFRIRVPYFVQYSSEILL